jgi:hypothetical protein
VLISAVSYELVFEAVSSAAVTGFPILGLFAGAATFFFSDRYVSGMVGSKADSAGSGEASSLVVPMVPKQLPARAVSRPAGPVL